MDKLTQNVDIKKLKPKQANTFFDSLISSILTYGSEVWGSYEKWDKNVIEKVHLRYYVNIRIDYVNIRIDYVNIRIDYVNIRIDYVNIWIDYVNIRIDYVNIRIDYVNIPIELCIHSAPLCRFRQKFEKISEQQWCHFRATVHNGHFERLARAHLLR